MGYLSLRDMEPKSLHTFNRAALARRAAKMPKYGLVTGIVAIGGTREGHLYAGIELGNMKAVWNITYNGAGGKRICKGKVTDNGERRFFHPTVKVVEDESHSLRISHMLLILASVEQ